MRNDAEERRFTDEQEQALWSTAERAGLSRRGFLALLAAGGATAVLSACVPGLNPKTEPAPAPGPPPAPAPAPGPIPAARPIVKPTPGQFFIPLGTNAEMRFEVMSGRQYAMPNSFFFVRSHTTTPVIDVKDWRLRVEGDGVAKPVELSYDDLLAMPARTMTRFVECAGNGRSFFDSLLGKPAQGGQWRLGAYGVAEWTGVPLSEVLNRAGIKGAAVDVMATGLDSLKVERPVAAERAMAGDAILAYMMNGDLLPPDHGFPARVIAPGLVGVVSIKWVGKLTVSEKPIFVDKNTTSYVLVGPDYSPQPPARGPVVTEQVIKSACALPWPATLIAGPQKVTGYAWSPLGKIAGVEVSLDGGKTFREAALVGPNVEAAGTRWEYSFDATPGDITITPRAIGEKGDRQHDISAQKWNELGYLFGAVVPHPVKVVG